MKKQFYFLFFVLFTTQFVLAAEVKNETLGSTQNESVQKNESLNLKMDDLKSLDYPELQVVPRASERLQFEAQQVRDKGMYLMAPFILSSVTTLTAGLIVPQHLKSDLSDTQETHAKENANFAVGIGALGLAAEYWYVATDNYNSSLNQIRNIKTRDRRSDLMRERIAEESFEKTANQISTWKWVFSITNAAACASLIDKSEGNNNLAPLIGSVMALLPLFVTSQYEINYQKQMEYKKKIYIPITWMDYQINSQNHALEPRMNLVWNF